MGLGIAEVHQESIPEELGDMSIKASNHLGTGGLVGTDHFPVIFWVELAGEFGGIDQVTEHDRQLPSFSFWSMRSGAWVFARSSVLCQSACLLERCLGSEGQFRCRFASPNQHLPVLIYSKPLDLDDLNF